MTENKTLVEVVVPTANGNKALGIMNVEQALSLPEEINAQVSHPDKEAGATDDFIDREELERHPAASE